MTRRNLSCFAAGLVIAGIGFLSGMADPPPNVAEDMINSVLQRGDTYLASTKSGLYQASETDHIWHKMPALASMPTGGKFAQQSVSSPRLLYFTGSEFDGFPMMDQKGSLFVSDDAGKTWAPTSLEQDVHDAFAHPNGSIFAVTEEVTTTPFPPGGDSISTNDKNGVPHYPHDHLFVSHDDGHVWQDITPPLRAAYGLYGIFQDPDHPDLICVRSAMIGHISRPYIFQAVDGNYLWKEISSEKWHVEQKPQKDFFGYMSGGANNGEMPPYLENFFNYPYARTSNFQELPTMSLKSERLAYQFHLHQSMPVLVSTVFMGSYPAIKWLDNKNEKTFWGAKIQPEGELSFYSNPLAVELNVEIPDKATKKAAYLGDPELITAHVDQSHPYQRAVDLAKLYAFTKPGRYRLQIFHTDMYLVPEAGSTLSTGAIDLSILP